VALIPAHPAPNPAPQTALPADPVPEAAGMAGRAARPAGLWGRRLYALHLLTVFGIALSNVFLGLTILLAPFALRGAAIPWPKLRPLYRPLALYVLLLAASASTGAH